MNEVEKPEEALFNTARQLTDPRQRAAFLDAASGGDAALRRRIDDLFAVQSQADAFFARAAGSSVSPEPGKTVVDPDFNPPLSEGPGTRIGRYKLLQQIGEGGFGTVFMAEQTEPVTRKVALKILKLGMDTKPSRCPLRG